MRIGREATTATDKEKNKSVKWVKENQIENKK